MSNDKNKCIEHLGAWEACRCIWSFNRRRPFFLCEQELLEEFTNTMFPIGPLSNRKDLREWILEDSRSYSSSSACRLLQEKCQCPKTRDPQVEQIFKNIWKTKASPKVLALVWQALWDRLLTKDNLLKRRVLNAQQDLSCVFCSFGVESIGHLLL